jgi:septal ring factor EnvC (AmiA/AmiB activator)
MQASLSASVAELEQSNVRLQAELAAEREENERLRALIEPCDECPDEFADAIATASAVVDRLSDSQRARHMTVEEALELLGKVVPPDSDSTGEPGPDSTA